MGNNGVDGKTILGDDNIGVGTKQCVGDKLNDFIGAITENDLARINTEFVGHLLPQIKSIPVGVKVRLFGCRLHGLHGLWRRAQRVFVGSQFDDSVQ